jgi:transcriptional regulator with XRE-family HTH domain
MKERLNAILKHFKINASQFADEIGVQRASVSHVLSERNKPGFDFIQRILDTYPSISADWLITGKGEMLKSKNVKQYLFSEMEVAEEAVNDDKKARKQTLKSSDGDQVENKRSFRVRNIEKIVVFYSDKSFGEYFPE